MGAVATHPLHRLAAPDPERLPKGLDALNHAVQGRWKRQRTRASGLLREAAAVEAEAVAMAALSDGALRSRLGELRASVRRTRGALEAPQRVPALAALREAGTRAWGLRAFPEQLAGAIGLDEGILIEMATGEGKTLVAALAAALAGWRGRPVHVVTVNDYLARRDADHFARLADWTGLSVAAVTAPLKPRERQAAYRADVVYTTSKELLADFLRDRLALGPAPSRARLALRDWSEGARLRRQVVQRGLHTAIVDEADSVLIDEAVTPLIISREQPNEALREACVAAFHLARKLVPGRDFRIDHRHKRIDLNPRGEAHLATLVEGLPGLWRGAERRREMVEQALQADAFFAREKQYIVQDGKVTIVDEFSGRLMPQRTWREGLHQAIEVREGLEVTSPTETLARMSFQRFFRLFPQLSGMTGTAREASGELWQIYQLPVVAIPTHRPVRRVLVPERRFLRQDQKWAAIVAEIETVHATGRPVLVGTRSIAASEELDARLKARGLLARVLNARRHEEEAAIITGAGERGALTIATNMAGRGTDIRLAHGIAELGGLHVIATERHEARRIDRQLFGRAGRQGDAGSARAFVSAEDELLVRFLPLPGRWMFTGLERFAPPLARWAMGPGVALAQRLAQRRASKQRRHVLQNDQWLEDSLGFAGAQKT